MGDGAGGLGPVAIVDDDASVRNALQRLLTSVGIVSVTESSGAAFLESPELHQVDCLILDVHLPGLSGMEVLSRVRVAATKLPVVLMTGRYDTDFAAEAIEAGASAVLRKPFDETGLFTALETATGYTVAH